MHMMQYVLVRTDRPTVDYYTAVDWYGPYSYSRLGQQADARRAATQQRIALTLRLRSWLLEMSEKVVSER
jgi:hypothetical protein